VYSVQFVVPVCCFWVGSGLLFWSDAELHPQEGPFEGQSPGDFVLDVLGGCVP